MPQLLDGQPRKLVLDIDNTFFMVKGEWPTYKEYEDFRLSDRSERSSDEKTEKAKIEILKETIRLEAAAQGYIYHNQLKPGDEEVICSSKKRIIRDAKNLFGQIAVFISGYGGNVIEIQSKKNNAADDKKGQLDAAQIIVNQWIKYKSANQLPAFNLVFRDPSLEDVVFSCFNGGTKNTDKLKKEKFMNDAVSRASRHLVEWSDQPVLVGSSMLQCCPQKGTWNAYLKTDNNKIEQRKVKDEKQIEMLNKLKDKIRQENGQELTTVDYRAVRDLLKEKIFAGYKLRAPVTPDNPKIVRDQNLFDLLVSVGSITSQHENASEYAKVKVTLAGFPPSAHEGKAKITYRQVSFAIDKIPPQQVAVFDDERSIMFAARMSGFSGGLVCSKLALQYYQKQSDEKIKTLSKSSDELVIEKMLLLETSSFLSGQRSADRFDTLADALAAFNKVLKNAPEIKDEKSKQDDERALYSSPIGLPSKSLNVEVKEAKEKPSQTVDVAVLISESINQLLQNREYAVFVDAESARDVEEYDFGDSPLDLKVTGSAHDDEATHSAIIGLFENAFAVKTEEDLREFEKAITSFGFEKTATTASEMLKIANVVMKNQTIITDEVKEQLTTQLLLGFVQTADSNARPVPR